MALSKSITSLIAESNGAISQSFLALKAEEWAVDHMQRRYNAAPPNPGDTEDHPAKMCFTALVNEHHIVRRWFTSEGQLSPLMMAQSLARQLAGGSIGNGYGWDFLPTGDPDPSMLQFKGMLIAMHRVLELKPRSQKLEQGGAEIGGVAKLVRSAYMTRAETHPWTAVGDVSAADVSRRWVSFRTYNFLVRSGVEPEWAWGMAKCRDVFGTIDCGAVLQAKSE